MNSSPCVCTYYICGYYGVPTTSAIEIYRHLICHLSSFRRFVDTACVLIYISLVVTTGS